MVSETEMHSDFGKLPEWHFQDEGVPVARATGSLPPDNSYVSISPFELLNVNVDVEDKMVKKPFVVWLKLVIPTKEEIRTSLLPLTTPARFQLRALSVWRRVKNG